MIYSRKAILEYIKDAKLLTLDESFIILGCKTESDRTNLSTLLSRIVKEGLITRIKPGVFKYNGR